MAMPPDRLDQRIRTMTRSGRFVKPPIRYEPDSDQVMEDDFSGEEDSDWGCVEEAQTEDDCDDSGDSEQSEFTQSDCDDDSSYQSTSSDSSSSEEADEDTSGTSLEEEEEEEEGENDVDDVLHWETLTIDASDEYSSADDQDL